MPLEVTVDNGQGIINIRGWGKVADADLNELREVFREDPALNLTFTRLCDLSAVTEASITSVALEEWAADPIANPAVRHAVVCTQPNAVKLATEFMARSRRYHREVCVFPTQHQALTWMSSSET